MSKKNIKNTVKEILSQFLKDVGYELYNVEFIKEGKDWFLRVYIEKSNSEENIGTDDCEKVSRFLNDKLDEIDIIDQNYYLEVSSPGIDRELVTIEHYKRYIGEEVDIKLYKSNDGKKTITGILKDASEEIVKVVDNEDREWVLQYSDIAKTNLTIVF